MVKMENVKVLRSFIKEALEKAKFAMIPVALGIWIDCDDFQEKENGILFMRKGHSSGYVSNEIFSEMFSIINEYCKCCESTVEFNRLDGE